MASSEHPRSSNLHKRSLEEAETVLSEDPSPPLPKRVCLEGSPSHLAILKEFCDLSGEDESVLDTQADESSTHEDLVAEMMKSLEKVIESKGSPDMCEFGEKHVDLGWNEFSDVASVGDAVTRQESSTTGDEYGCDYDKSVKEDEIRHLMQASDDELGIPSCTAEFSDGNFEEEWANSISDESAVAASYAWLDGSFHLLDESLAFTSRDFYEPVILF